MEYILSVKWDDPHGEICYIDSVDGSIDVRTPREEWPEFRYTKGRMVLDLDDDGNDDIITIYRSSDPREIRMACFDPFTGERHWNQPLLEFDPSFSTDNIMEIIDLDGDEDPELLVQFGTYDHIAQGQPFVFIIEPEDGRIVATWENTLLLPFRPDLNGNGIPEISIRQNDGQVCMVEMIGGLVLKIDYTGNFLIYQNDIDGHLFRIVDLDSDGKDDLILLRIDHGYSSQNLFSTDYPDGICIMEQYVEAGRYNPSLSGGVFNTIFTIGEVLQGFSIPLGEIPVDVRELEVQTITFTEERYVGRVYFKDDDASDDDTSGPVDTDDDEVPDNLIVDHQDDLNISPIMTFSIITLAMLASFLYVVNKWRKY